jgi:hypothetical protein
LKAPAIAKWSVLMIHGPPVRNRMAHSSVRKCELIHTLGKNLPSWSVAREKPLGLTLSRAEKPFGLPRFVDAIFNTDLQLGISLRRNLVRMFANHPTSPSPDRAGKIGYRGRGRAISSIP